MGTNIEDEQLIGYLINFVTGMPVGCDEIRIVELYGNKKPSQLFDTTTTNHHHVFTQLKKIKENGKNFNRAIVGGGGSWKESYPMEHVVDKNKSVIGIKKEFRFKEENHVWIMKDYSLIDSKLKGLSGRIQHEGFVVCRIMRDSSSSQCQGSVKSFAQENHDECSVRQEVVHQETHPDVYTQFNVS
uniref:NAC transcription factor n=1 Tax=Solanum tuberosum TaxID=4113 RepID=M1DCP9_SOLTU